MFVIFFEETYMTDRIQFVFILLMLQAKPPAGLLILTKAIVHGSFVQTSVSWSPESWLVKQLESAEFIQRKVNVQFVDLPRLGRASRYIS